MLTLEAGVDVNADRPPQEASVSEVIDAIWAEIRLILGATMAATLIRRAIVDCGERCLTLSRIDIGKNGAGYTYTVPPEIEDDPDARAELPDLVDTLLMHLSRISGDVLVSILLRNHIIRETAGKEWSERGQS
jgi:hypothetical protein